MSSRPVALVTGASMGLGADYARLAAKDGMDVVLVARSKDKLDALAAELRAAHQSVVHVIPVDLDRRDAVAVVESAVEALGVHIDVLVNNAGFGTSGAFVELDRARELSMVHVNIEALVGLTHAFGRRMVARGHGRILLVASTAGFQPAPGMAVYCATKAFVLSFGDALAYELRGTGVTVTTHCPGATATEFARTSGSETSLAFKTPGLVASSASCAEHGFAAMKRGRTISVHGLLNWLASVFSPRLPRVIIRRIVARVVGFEGTKRPSASGEG